MGSELFFLFFSLSDLLITKGGNEVSAPLTSRPRGILPGIDWVLSRVQKLRVDYKRVDAKINLEVTVDNKF